MKIGIFGTTGFIGRSLLEHFLSRKFDIVSLSRHRPDIKSTKFTHSSVSFEEVTSKNRLGYDTLILCVSSTNPNTPGNNLYNEHSYNISPYIKLLNQLKNTNIKHLIYLSSGGTVYGNQNIAVIDESCETLPSTPYGFGKLCIEEAIRHLWSGECRHYTILRPSNPVGKYQLKSIGSNGLVTTTYERLQKNELINIFGNGETVRDYLHISDFCSLIEKIVLSTATENRILNVSSAKGYSINEVVDHMASFLGKEAKKQYLPHLQPQIHRNVLCNKLTRQLFDWSPITDIKEIISLLHEEIID